MIVERRNGGLIVRNCKLIKLWSTTTLSNSDVKYMRELQTINVVAQPLMDHILLDLSF